MPTDDPTAPADRLLAAINALCEAYAKAQTARVDAHHATTEAQYEHGKARAAYWDAQVSAHYQTLIATMQKTVPAPTQIEAFLPVRLRPDGHVEVHAHDDTARPFVVRMTGAEAVALAVHLTAYGAISRDRTGQHLDPILPPVTTPTPPRADTTPAVGNGAPDADPAPPTHRP
jgi:hypothetical protein